MVHKEGEREREKRKWMGTMRFKGSEIVERGQDKMFNSKGTIIHLLADT